MVSPRTRNLPPRQVHIVALVLDVHQTTQDRLLVVLGADAEYQQLGLVLLRRAEAVDGRHRRHHDRVAPV